MYKTLNNIIKYVGVFICCTVLIIGGSRLSNANAAGNSESFVTSDLNHTINISVDGSKNSYYTHIFFDLYDIIPELDRSTAITGIKYRVKFGGSNAPVNNSIGLNISMFADYTTYWNSLGRSLSDNNRADSPVGQWFEYDFSFDPDNGDYMPNLFGIRAYYTEYRTCYWTIEILEVRYNKYDLDVNLSLDENRHVVVDMGRSSGNLPSNVSVKNINDNRILLNRNQFTSGEYLKSVIDTAVSPEATYFYEITFTVGSTGSGYGGPPATYIKSIRVPSDATIAAEKAELAKVAAENVVGYVSNANGNTITAVRDDTTTALIEAMAAKTNAQNAYAEAVLAKNNSLNAYNTALAVSDKMDSMVTDITNIQNNLGKDMMPPIVKIKTLSGALATSGNVISVVLEISDNQSSEFTYSIDGISYSPVPGNKVIPLTLNVSGPNIKQVWVKDEAGNIGNSTITIRKI